MALHAISFTQFEHYIHFEKLHNVSYTGTGENKTVCKNFILDISDYFLQEDIQKKIELVNFIAVLWDGSTNKSITEQKVIYIIYVNLKTNLPVIKFFEIAAPENSQDAPGLKEAIISAFSGHGLYSSLKKMVFFSSDGASINSDSNSRLIRLFQDNNPWLSFIWYFSQHFELSFKDALSEFFEPVDTSLTHLSYLYSNSAKKHRELKSLYLKL